MDRITLATPQANDLEKIIIGSMLIESDCIDTVFQILNKECFYNDNCAIIFGAIENLYNKKQTVDIITITHELKRTRQLDIVGGAYEISSLSNSISSTSNIEAHCRIVLQQFMRRKLIDIARTTTSSAYDEYQDVLKVTDDFIAEGKKLYDHMTFGKTNSTTELLAELMQDLEEQGVTGRKSGIKELDDIIVCFEPGLKYTIAGRPSMGKTAMAKTFACNLADQNSPGIIFSMEVTAKQFMVNITSGVCEIDNERLRKKLLSEEEKKSIWEKMGRFKKELIIIDDKSMITPEYIYKKIKKAIKTHQIEWFMVDYTQMGKVENAKGKMKEERVGDFSQALKDICKSENVFCLEIAQVKRLDENSKKGSRPSLQDLKDSGTIEASADTVMLLYRPEYYGYQTFGPNKEDSKGVTEIIVAKQRGGRTASALATFLPQYTKFINRKPSETIGIYTGEQIDEF
ncbi:MAG: hypothetical protein IT212_07420 [Bacteroidia bacterium]|nr:hypothetical protein [Bacteroidia bacterium]